MTGDTAPAAWLLHRVGCDRCAGLAPGGDCPDGAPLRAASASALAPRPGTRLVPPPGQLAGSAVVTTASYAAGNREDRVAAGLYAAGRSRPSLRPEVPEGETDAWDDPPPPYTLARRPRESR